MLSLFNMKIERIIQTREYKDLKGEIESISREIDFIVCNLNTDVEYLIKLRDELCVQLEDLIKKMSEE